MKNTFTTTESRRKGFPIRIALPAVFLFLSLAFSPAVMAINTKTATSTGNWSNPATWSPAGVPQDTDNVVIAPSGANTTITVDGNYTCRNLIIGGANNYDAKVKINTVGNSLTITGDLQMNPNTWNKNYELDAGPGDIAVNGTFSFWGTLGDNKLKVGAGTMTIVPDVAITDLDQLVEFTGGGIITFQGNFSDAHNNMTFSTGCVVNFYGNYTISGTAVDWNNKGTANFYGSSKTITATANIAMNTVNVQSGASVTLSSSGAGTFIIEGNLTLNSGTFTANKSYRLDGSLTNNGGTYTSGGSTTLSMTSGTGVISGSNSCSFSTLQIGKSTNESGDVSITLSKSATASNLVFTGTSKMHTLKLNTSGVTLTVTGNVTMNQNTKDNKVNTLNVHTGTLTVNGNLVFAGTNNTDSRSCQITVGSGTFNLDGTLTWMSNTKVKTEVISVTTGTVNFNSSITMGSSSGTIKVTTSGTVNFNGTTAPSLAFGGSTAPALTMPYGSNCTFAKGLTATTTALTFDVGSNQTFTGTGTITPTAAITFGNYKINPGATITLAGNISVKGNWINKGTFTPSTYTVTMSGNGNQIVSDTTGTNTFYKLTLSVNGTILDMSNDIVVTNTLTMNGHKIKGNGYTLTLGNGSGAALVYTIGRMYGGTFKRYWPTSAITSNSGNWYGYFPLGTSSKNRQIEINSTSSPTTAGYVSAIAVDVSGATNVTYTDNEGSSIQAIANQHSDISLSGLAGGTYTLWVKFSDLGGGGSLSNFKLETYTGGTMGSTGTHSTTGGPTSAPVGKRTGVSAANLANAWVIGTNDKNASPLYTYLYSRKSGNWNDGGANGTWSYTAGGSGAACNCTPTGAAYVTIESGHTVTVTQTTDSAQYLDISGGGAVTVNSSKTLNIVADLHMLSTGTFTNNGTIKVGNEMLMSSATSPTVNGNVTVVGYFTLPSGTAYAQTSGTLTVNGDIEINGDLSFGASGSLVLDGNNALITGAGTVTTASGGNFPITNAHTFDEDANLTFGTSGTNTKITIAANTTITNCGIITINGKLMAANASTSAWMQQGNAILSVTDSLLPTGIFDPSTSPNTVYYNGSGNQKIISSTTAYYNLSATNGGTKTMVGDLIITNALTLGGTTILDEGSYVLSGNASLNMSGTAELKLTRSAEDTYPELTGTYNCTGGTVTITQTADSCQVQEGTYYNLKLNGSTPYNLSSVTAISNNLDVTNTASINGNGVLAIGGTFTHSSTSNLSFLDDSIAVGGLVLSAGTLNAMDQSINVNGAGGWTRATGATFTPGTNTVYFKGTSNQTLGGTCASQSFYSMVVNKSSNTLTVGGSTTTLNIAGDLTLSAGVFDKGTATTINMNGGNWNNDGGVFTPGLGTVVFCNSGSDQAIQGTNTTETFNHVTVNKTANVLVLGGSLTSVTLSGTMTLTSGVLNAGSTARTIEMTGGNWTNNGATYVPEGSTILFNGTGAQAINGTAASQTFNKMRVNKSSGTLSVSGSTTTLNFNSDVTLSAGTFDAGTAVNIHASGDWINDGGTFTPGIGTVECNSGVDQAIRGTASSETFYKLTVNKSGGDLNISGSIAAVTINNTLTFTSGKISTGSAKIVIPVSSTVTGAGTGKYINGTEEIYIPNTAAPSRTFHVGDASVYAPVVLDFTGTVSGSGSIGVHCSSGDDAAISTSGIDPNKSVNRNWTITNNGVTGFTSFAPTYNFVAGDVDGGATPANFEIRRYSGGTWYTTTPGTRTSTSTQATGVTDGGRTQIGEKATLTVATHPGDTTACDGNGVYFTSTSTSTPTPTVKWQRDPNTGTFADITGGMDGGVYSNYTTTTLNVADVAGLSNYKYRAVFTNINGSVNSNQATLTVNPTPTITGTTPGSRCDAGTVNLSATASAGTINWYAAASGGASLGSGSPFTTPSISTTTTYYVDATSGGCTTASRTSVTATVNTTPTITGTTPGTRCDGGTVDLGATASAGTINWYAATSGGVSLGTGTSFTTPTISTTTTYYVDATANSCTTGSRTSVVATVHPLPTATVAYQSCAGVDGNTTIRVAGSGGTGPYTFKLNSGSFVSSDTFHIANASSQNYYTQDAFGCSSAPTNYVATAIVPTQVPASVGTTTCSCPSSAEGRDVYLTDSAGNLIVIINDMGHDLGTITATVYTRATPVLVANNQGGTDAALGRSYVLDFNGSGLTPAVEVKFPFTNQEYNDLVVAAAATPIASDDINSMADIGSTQYEGPDEDDTYNTSAYTMLEYHRQLTNGTILGGKYVTIGLAANGEHWLGGNGNGSPLPVKLVSFDAVPNQTMEVVETEWVTSLEVNNHYFAVERSEDGINYNEIGRVDGAGNYTGTLTYRFTDVKPVTGLSYYRLKQVDFDGDFEYSNVVAVTLGSQTSFQLYPNPSSTEVNIAVGNPSDEIKLTVCDLNGREVFGRTYPGANGMNKNQVITFPATDVLSAGMYMVTVSTNGVEFKQKLVLN